MQTSFTEEQLRDPLIAEANGILRACVHYGFCTNACPTYVLTRDENESPRGRIDLIRAMLEKGGAPDPRTVRHIDTCLSCLSCMSTCAVKVDYAHLIDRARAHVERHHHRPLADRLMRAGLARTLTRPRLFRRLLTLARVVRPFRSLLPVRLRTLLDGVPPGITPDIVAAQVYPAQGERRRRVALLAGCAQQALNGNINAASIRLLQRQGCDVVIAERAGCCGSLPLHMGREEEAKALARRNIKAWIDERERAGLDAIIVNASGCGTTVKDYGHLFQHDADMREPARIVGGLARDISEELVVSPVKAGGGAKAYRVAYHDPCSLQHAQKVTEPPRVLLRQAGFEVLDIPEKHFCCGSAGTYNLLQPETAAVLGARKARNIHSTDPDIIATGNIGCMAQIARHSPLPVLHLVELLDWAEGGSTPPALERRELRPLAPAKAPTGESAPAGETGIW